MVWTATGAIGRQCHKLFLSQTLEVANGPRLPSHSEDGEQRAGAVFHDIKLSGEALGKDLCSGVWSTFNEPNVWSTRADRRMDDADASTSDGSPCHRDDFDGSESELSSDDGFETGAEDADDEAAPKMPTDWNEFGDPVRPREPKPVAAEEDDLDWDIPSVRLADLEPLSHFEKESHQQDLLKKCSDEESELEWDSCGDLVRRSSPVAAKCYAKRKPRHSRGRAHPSQFNMVPYHATEFSMAKAMSL